MNRQLFVILILLFIFCFSAFAQEKYIGNVMSSGAKEHYTLVVETVPKKLYLLKVDGDGQRLVDESDILTGREGGSKEIQNDGKTPEGVYYFVNFMTDRQMHTNYGDIAARYGIAAYPTNYPNPIDRIMKRTGYGIWLHGLDPENHKPATEGCVAMQNTEMERMMPHLSVGMPMVIINEAMFMNEEDYSKLRAEHLEALNEFIHAWNYGDFDTFKEFVHEKYSSYSAPDAKKYLSKKKSLMESYPKRSIDIENVNIYRQNDLTLVYDFDQFYCADNLVSYGNKRLYLVAEDGKDKVISEQMSEKPLRQYLEPHIAAFLNEWKASWESKDIENYMKYYSLRFPGRSQWESNKSNIFESAGDIKVDISDVSWEITKGNNIRIRFTQTYQSDSNSDKGVKTLTVSGCPGSYTIHSENWSAR